MATASTLLIPAQTAVVSSGTALVTIDTSRIEEATFQLEVTAAATAAGDTLDVFIQHSMNGTTWDDFVHFTQVKGNDAMPKRFNAQWSGIVVPTNALRPEADGTLAVGVAQGLGGSDWRVKWTVASSSAPSFTFNVRMRPLRRPA